jgi:protein ImuB
MPAGAAANAAAHALASARAHAPAASGVDAGSGSGTAPRPVWIQAPEPLAERGTRPLFEGRPLQLLSGPERIEAGWWDAALAERDYFIAETGEGALVWIYRDRLPLARRGEEGDGDQASGWFLQGRFG